MRQEKGYKETHTLTSQTLSCISRQLLECEAAPSPIEPGWAPETNPGVIALCSFHRERGHFSLCLLVEKSKWLSYV
jgi:hypothetical protein